MKSINYFIIFTLLMVGINVSGQEISNKFKGHFFIEDNIMISNWDAEFFPVFNNDVSFSYGLNEFIGIGAYYDLYSINKKVYNIGIRKGKLHSYGLKLTCSLLPLLPELENKLRNVSINLDGRFSYNDSPYIGMDPYLEKKDRQEFVNYYRLNVKYFIIPGLYVSANAGIINSNRFLLGVGVKL